MQLLLEEVLKAEWSDSQAKAEPWDSGHDRQIEKKELEVLALKCRVLAAVYSDAFKNHLAITFFSHLDISFPSFSLTGL